MEYIKKADLYFILPINEIVDLKGNGNTDRFLSKLLEIQKDEFSEKLNESTKRFILYEGSTSYRSYEWPLKIYINNFLNQKSSLIYLKLELRGNISLVDYANLVNGKNILHKCNINEISIHDFLVEGGIKKEQLEYVFLFTQLIDVFPQFPVEYDEGMKYIQTHRQSFHQLLLRSDTFHNDLRIDNHLSNLENISNFYGAIDLCSPISLIQIYQYQIQSICEKNNYYDLEHRACWWLAITDVIFIQKSFLSDTLKKINNVQGKDKKKSITAINQIGKVLLNMKDYWYFEDMTHEISKKVVYKVKEKIGVTAMLSSVLSRVEGLENAVLREINEAQNEYNFYLNIILLLIAIIQIVPLIFQILQTIFYQENTISISQILLWIQSFAISLSFPVLIWIIRNVNKKRFMSNIIQIKKNSENL
jgi:hypothetical protein